MKIQASSALGPILILTLAARFANAAAIDRKEDVAPHALNNKYAADGSAVVDATGSMEDIVLMTTGGGMVQIVALDIEPELGTSQLELEDDGEDCEYDEDDEDDEGDEEVDEDNDEHGDVDAEGVDTEHPDAQLLGLAEDNFHYANHLLAPQPDNQQCPVLQKRDEIPPAQARTENSDDSTVVAVHPTLSRMERLASGGSCIDSFANFALGFCKQCTVQCLQAMIQIFSDPNIPDLLSCFSCTNYIVQGITSIGTDCAGIFTDTKPYSALNQQGAAADRSGEATPKKSKDLRLSDLQKDVDSADAGLALLNFGDMVEGLNNVDMEELQNWFDIGEGVYHAVEASSKAHESNKNKSEKNGAAASRAERHNVHAKRAEVDRDAFNKFVSKAAGFANWKLTPDMIESSGVFNRLHGMHIL